MTSKFPSGERRPGIPCPTLETVISGISANSHYTLSIQTYFDYWQELGFTYFWLTLHYIAKLFLSNTNLRSSRMV